MSEAPFIKFDDGSTFLDFTHFVRRSRTVRDAGLHLYANGDVLAAYVSVLAPQGLADSTPLVLGARMSRLAAPLVLDTSVNLTAVIERLERAELSERGISVPRHDVSISWAGNMPPRQGWQAEGSVPSGALVRVAQEGIEQLTQALPAQPGAHVVASARAHIWGAPPKDGWSMAETREPSAQRLPAGAAFAAYALGFLRYDGPVQLFRAGRWLRLSSPAGHVLVKGAL